MSRSLGCDRIRFYKPIDLYFGLGKAKTQSLIISFFLHFFCSIVKDRETEPSLTHTHAYTIATAVGNKRPPRCNASWVGVTTTQNYSRQDFRQVGTHGWINIYSKLQMIHLNISLLQYVIIFVDKSFIFSTRGNCPH